MLRKQINGTTLRGTDGIDRTLNAVTLSEDEKKKVGELDFLQNDILLADGVKAVAANDKVGLTEEEVQKGLAEGKWLPIREGTAKSGFGNRSIVESDAYLTAGRSAHAEGYLTRAIGDYSHAEGYGSSALGIYSHAEGYTTKAIEGCAHSEGYETLAEGDSSHSEGSYCQAYGISSHTEGNATIAYSEAEHAEGTYNYSQKDMFISTIGIGTKDNRKNGFAVDRSGNIFILGLGGYEGQSSEGKTSLQTLLLSYQQRISDLETKIAELENTAKSE